MVRNPWPLRRPGSYGEDGFTRQPDDKYAHKIDNGPGATGYRCEEAFKHAAPVGTLGQTWTVRLILFAAGGVLMGEDYTYVLHPVGTPVGEVTVVEARATAAHHLSYQKAP